MHGGTVWVYILFDLVDFRDAHLRAVSGRAQCRRACGQITVNRVHLRDILDTRVCKVRRN